MSRPLPAHGTPSRYRGDPRPKKSWAPCRCEPCTTAQRRATKLRDLRKARGITADQPVGPIADHINTLVASGWSMLGIERESGVGIRSLYSIRYRRQATVRKATAARVLAVRPGRDPYYINATGTRRRLQALAAIGYPMAWVARQVGMSERGIQEIGRGRWATVLHSTWKTIDDLYQQHAHTPGPSGWTRAHAARNGWRDPLWWEDMGHIDDPTFDPAKADQPLGRDELGALRREEISHLAHYGYQPEQIRARLNDEVSIGTVRAIVQELRTGVKRDRTKKQEAAA